jgi:hypothetical protein
MFSQLRLLMQDCTQAIVDLDISVVIDEAKAIQDQITCGLGGCLRCSFLQELNKRQSPIDAAANSLPQSPASLAYRGVVSPYHFSIVAPRIG